MLFYPVPCKFISISFSFSSVSGQKTHVYDGQRTASEIIEWARSHEQGKQSGSSHTLSSRSPSPSPSPAAASSTASSSHTENTASSTTTPTSNENSNDPDSALFDDIFGYEIHSMLLRHFVHGINVFYLLIDNDPNCSNGNDNSRAFEGNPIEILVNFVTALPKLGLVFSSITITVVCPLFLDSFSCS